MPKYRITDSNLGLTVQVTGDSPPTEEEIEGIFTEIARASQERLHEEARSEDLGKTYAEALAEQRSSVLKQQTRQTLAEAAVKNESPEEVTDVLFDIPTLKIDDIKLNVENLNARVALDATVANLVRIIVGAQVGIEKVDLDIRGVEAQAILKVKLRQVYSILARALDSVDANPTLIQTLLQPVTEAVGGLGREAGRAAGELGTQAGKALGPGGAVGDTIRQAGEAARETLAPGGLVRKGTDDLGEAAKGVTAPEGPVKEAVKDVSKGVDQAVKGKKDIKEKERRRFFRHDVDEQAA